MQRPAHQRLNVPHHKKCIFGEVGRVALLGFVLFFNLIAQQPTVLVQPANGEAHVAATLTNSLTIARHHYDITPLRQPTRLNGPAQTELASRPKSAHSNSCRRHLFGIVLARGVAVALSAPLAPAEAARAEAPAAAGPLEPTAAELKEIAGAFATMSMEPKPEARPALEEAESTLGRAIARYEGVLKRPKVERALLRLGRARARVLLNDLAFGKRPEKAAEAVKDLDVAIGIMEDDFKDNPGKQVYSEYPDALVRRALAQEELKQWAGAVEDYSRAISLWRPPPGTPDKALRGNVSPAEGDGLGVNPLVLNFRGNALCQLGRYSEALVDYQEAADIFTNDREFRQASLSRANEALALYGDGQREEAVRTMQAVVRKDPGVTDMHVALAAVYWAYGDVGRAEGEWLFACEKIDTGCQQYKDLEWVAEIRRWPPQLVNALKSFLVKVP